MTHSIIYKTHLFFDSRTATPLQRSAGPRWLQAEAAYVSLAGGAAGPTPSRKGGPLLDGQRSFGQHVVGVLIIPLMYNSSTSGQQHLTAGFLLPFCCGQQKPQIRPCYWAEIQDPQFWAIKRTNLAGCRPYRDSHILSEGKGHCASALGHS